MRTLFAARTRSVLRQALICLLLLGTPLLMSGTNTSQVYVQSVFAVAIIALLLILELPALLHQRNLRIPPLFWSLLALVLIASISVIGSRDVLTSLKAIVPMTVFILYALVLSNTVTDLREIHRYLACIALAAVITSGFGLLQYIGLLRGSATAMSGAAAVLSTFGQQAFLAAFAAAGMVISLGLVLSPRAGAVVRVLAGLGSVLPLVLLAALVQRGALFSLLAGLVTLFGLWFLVSRRARAADRVAASPLPPRRRFALGMAALLILFAVGVGVVLTNGARVISWRPPGGPFQPAVGRWQAGSPASVALFDVTSGTFYFEDRSSFPTRHQGSLPVVGDWDGNGSDDLGVYDPRTGRFTLFLGPRAEPIERNIQFGPPAARVLPVAGDWNGDGVSGIGLYDPADSTWRLRETPTEGLPDRTLAFGTGQAHCDAVVGDWNGSGITLLGVYDYYTKRFDLLTTWPAPTGGERQQETLPAPYLQQGDIPIAGAFAETPAAGVGVFRVSALQISIDRFRGGTADRVAAWGRGSWGDFVQSRTLRAQSYVGDLRLADWLIAADMLFQHPLLGVGIGNYKLRFTDHQAVFLARPTGRPYLDREFPRAEQAHNDFVQWAAETGLAGGVLMLAALLAFLMTALRGVTRAAPSERVVRLALFAGVIAICVDALLLFPFHLPATAVLAATAAGLLCAPALQPEARSYRISRRLALGFSVAAIAGLVFLLFACWRDVTADRAFILGRRALLQRDTAGAKADFFRSRSLGLPAPGQVSYHLGTIAESENDLRFAAAYFEEAQRRQPSPVAYLKAARYRILRGDTAGARDLIQVLVHLAPPKSPLNVETRLVEANLEVAGNRPAVAEAILRRILQDVPDTVGARLALAYLLEDQGRRAEAVEQLTIALSQVTQQWRAQSLTVASLQQRATVSVAELADAIGRLEQLERLRQEVIRTMNFISGGGPSAATPSTGSSPTAAPSAEPQ